MRKRKSELQANWSGRHGGGLLQAAFMVLSLRWFSNRTRLALSTLACVCALVSGGKAEVIERFEGLEPTWTLADADCTARIVQQQRQFQNAHSGQGCEFLRLEMTQGTYVYLTHTIPASPVIAEFAASVWVKSDRPGIQLRARVVLPRTIDERTGKPMTTFLVGSSYQQPGAWQELSLDAPLLLLQRQQAVLRRQFGQHVDVRQAYIDRIVLNAHGGSNITNLWIDDLELNNHVSVGTNRDVLPFEPSKTARLLPTTPEEPAAPAAPRRESPQLRGSVLTIGGRPTLIRAVRQTGINMETARELGFNALVLSQPPANEQLVQAARHNLWLIAPPPMPAGGPESTTDERLPEYPGVLAWDLGDAQLSTNTDDRRKWAARIRRADGTRPRPIFGTAYNDWESTSRMVDILAVNLWSASSGNESGAPPAGAVLPQLRPGSAVWSRIALPSSNVGAAAEGAARRLRLSVYQAIADGVRGFVFDLPSGDPRRPDLQQLATTVRALNAELRLLEPWIAGGQGVERLACEIPHVSLYALQTDRARLLLALTDPESKKSTGPGRRPLTLIDSGAPNSADAYLISGADLRPLRRRRVAGGVEVTIDDVEPVTLVVITQEPIVVNYLARTLSGRTTQR